MRIKKLVGEVISSSSCQETELAEAGNNDDYWNCVIEEFRKKWGSCALSTVLVQNKKNFDEK